MTENNQQKSGVVGLIIVIALSVGIVGIFAYELTEVIRLKKVVQTQNLANGKLAASNQLLRLDLAKERVYGILLDNEIRSLEKDYDREHQRRMVVQQVNSQLRRTLKTMKKERLALRVALKTTNEELEILKSKNDEQARLIGWYYDKLLKAESKNLESSAAQKTAGPSGGIASPASTPGP